MDFLQHELDKATTEAEVLRSASDCLLLWTPREVGPLNLGLAELKVKSGEDIERVKRSLSTMYMEAPAATQKGSQLRQLAGYFGRASHRISELRRPSTSPRP